MFSSSVVILVREVLEAALLCSILLSVGRQYRLSAWTVVLAILSGMAVAVFYARQLPALAQLFDGVGQEVGDAASQLLLCLLLPLCMVLFIRGYYRDKAGLPPRGGLGLNALISVIFVLAVMREGAEIYLYVSSFQWQPDKRQSLYIGALIGTGIGFSVGALFYYFLQTLSVRRKLLAGALLLNLIAAGMALQACKMLIQADWLPDGQLWDSSGLITENSVSGQLLYALIGYEATPAPVQVLAYGAALAAIVALQLWAWRHFCRLTRPAATRPGPI